ncbi:GM12497 [Drosophila sechellia]|uniref:GM12497 n=1 Tax=Drosophila sechellia TaxID=7238 RepID=B4I098_DROSE|nr:GM12497 [Drosophila sechellia]
MYMNVYPSDNKLSQYTYTTTKPGDIFSLPPTTPPTINNEPTLTTTRNTTTTTTTTTSDNLQNHPKQSAIEPATDTDSQPIRKVKLSANEAKVVEEAPCVRRQYYQLGNEGENPETPESSGTPANKKPHQMRRPHDEPEPQLRRSSKSPSVETRQVQRETTFEGRRVSHPEDREISIDELILIEETSGVPGSPTVPSPRAQSPGKPATRSHSPEKLQPRATPRQSPEKEQPAFKQPHEVYTPSQPEKQFPRAQSAEKTPGWSQPQVSPRQSPEKQLPRAQSPEKGLAVRQPSVSPRQSPEKQVPDPQTRDQGPGLPRISPRQSPEKQLPKDVPQKTRQSPEKDLTSQQRREKEIFRSTITTTQKRTTNNLNEEFITNERDNQNQPLSERKPQVPANAEPNTKPSETIESPDGGFPSKSTEVEAQPEVKESPTYRKKGLTRRETFEDRCRQILGMEEDGDTQGTYTERPNNEQEDVNVSNTTIETIQVKIEDCPDDDEDDKPRRVTETYVVRTQPKIKVEEELFVDVTEAEDVEILVSPSKKSPKEGDSPKYPKGPETPNSPRKDQGIPSIPKKERSPVHSKKEETPRYPEEQDRYPKEPETSQYPKERPRNPKEDAETININEETTIVITKQGSKSPSPRWSPSPERRVPKNQQPPSPTASPSVSPVSGKKIPTEVESNFVTEKIIDCRGKTVVEKISQRPRTPSPTTPKKYSKPSQKIPERVPETESEPEKDSESETKKKTSVNGTKTETERRNSRTTKTKQPLPLKEPQSKVPAAKSPRKDSLTGRKRDSLVEETRTTTTTTTTRQGRKPSDTNGSPSIKDRLRSSPRKQKTSPQQTRTPTPAQTRNPEDDVDGDSSSPDASPTRVGNERRRSSNISVHTEIIIDHLAPKSPKTERRPQGGTGNVPSPIRKLPVTERKESAPVPRVTRRDKTEKVTRSTSENIIKMSGTKPHPEMSSLKPGGDRSRPSKCCTTKTINLSEQRINTATDIEGVIIDIQQAKSSREPSPDRIVPTPVPAELETGKPRYPDVVQEPDDEPRRKPQVTNIPIFEEESQTYVGCQISELHSSNGIEVDILDNPTVEAPKSLDYPVNTPDTDESLLSVHEKVSRFTHSAEKVKEPKVSAPFSREFDVNAKIPENDDCLLSINQKVDKFLRTAENVTRPSSLSSRPEIERPGLEEIDEELLRDDCTLSVSQKVHKFIDTAEKLAPTMPQKSPRLVANIERHISRQSEPERELDEESEPELDRDTDVEDDDQTSQLETEEEITQTVTKKETLKEFKQQTKETRETRRDPKAEPEKVQKKSPQTKPKEESARVPKYQAKVSQKVSQWEPKKQPQREPKVTQKETPWEPKKQPLSKLKDEPEKVNKREPKVPQKESQAKLKEEPERVNKKAPQKEPRKEPLRQSEEEPEFSPEEEFDDEPLPMTKTHTTAIEIKRQKDILSRPSVFGQRTPERKSSTTPSPTKLNGTRGRPSPSTNLITEEKRSYRNQVTNVSKPGTRKTTPSAYSPAQSPPPKATSISKRMEQISQQSWVVQDVDVDVEVVGPAPPSHISEKPQGKSPSPTSSRSPSRSPSRRTSTNLNTTSTTTTTTTEHPSTTKTTTPKPTPTNPSKDEPEITPIEYLTEKSITTTYTTNTTGRNVASRRNMFEPVHETQVDSEPTGRRPSYMDHTKSSLEHIRRDSLEINKSHYSRKSSMEDDSPVEPRNPNSSVKFDVPRKTSARGADEPRKTSLQGKDEDSDLELEIEEIFDLQRLEKLLETVASYEMRRRIRAQMRLIRKNMINAGTTTTITTITTSTAPGKSSPLPKRRDQSPAGAAEVKTKEVRTTTSRRQQQQRVEQVDSTTPTAPGKTSPHGKPPVKPRERSASPAQKRRISPQGKQAPGDRSTTTTTKVTNTSTTRGAPNKPAQGPIWADRSKVLKGHPTVPQTNGSTPRKGSTSSTTSSSGKFTRTMTSSSTTTSSSSTTNTRNKQREEDSITSSYGVGPTDENGLPLFGIRALKKKATPPAEEPCETKQEVTGYVIEEQFYSDNKSPPRHERKELIYSSNADELAAIKQQLQDEDDSSPPLLDARVVREFKKVESQQSLPEDARYVRRGSVKELSEKFIRKESSSSTHSTHSSIAQSLVRHEDETEDDSESNEVCSVIEAPQMRHNQSHTTSTTRSSNTRSFLDSSADQRQVTSVDDVLERMRNADNVEEPGDSTEDREARALLNKFLGASVIMQGVESMLPPTATGQRLNSQGVSKKHHFSQQNQGVFGHNFTKIVHTDK